LPVSEASSTGVPHGLVRSVLWVRADAAVVVVVAVSAGVRIVVVVVQIAAVAGVVEDVVGVAEDAAEAEVGVVEGRVSSLDILLTSKTD